MMNNDIKGNRQIFLATLTPFSFANQDMVGVSSKIALAAGLTPLDWTSYAYPVQGGTWIWFLGESHIAIDTYPEHGLLEVTLVSCKEFDTDKIVEAIMNAGYIIRELTIIKKNENHTWQL
jgi:S-adenosylmethionine/arginine decarboxylase-like enzyme